MTDHYDIIVIGSGPGGASAAQRLAPTSPSG
jgi:choline dehydrogenase-like flavoprotein